MLDISESAAINIANMLLSHKKISEKQMTQIQTLSKESGQDMISVIIDKNFASETDIANIISKSYDLPKIKISDKNINKEALSKLPKNFIISNQILPFSEKNGSLQVAIADPTRLSISSEIKTITNTNIDLFVTKLSEMEKGLKFLDSNNEDNQNFEESSINSLGNSNLQKNNIGENNENVETTSEVIKFVDDILIKAIKKGASDIHVEHFRNEPRIRFRTDGVMVVEKEFIKFLIKNYPAVVTRLKIMAESNISERSLPQDGAIQFQKRNVECDFRVSFLPTKYGERVNLRLLKKGAIKLELDKIYLKISMDY